MALFGLVSRTVPVVATSSPGSDGRKGWTGRRNSSGIVKHVEPVSRVQVDSTDERRFGNVIALYSVDFGIP